LKENKQKMNGTEPMPVVLLTPVLDTRLEWVGLYLEGCSTVSVASGLAERLAAGSPFPYRYVFLPFDATWLDADSLPFPAGQTVLMLDSAPGGELADACRALRRAGIHVAAPDLTGAATPDLLDFAIMPAAAARQRLPEKALRRVLERFKGFATEVDGTELLRWCAAAGFPFIACRTMAYVPDAKGQSPSRMVLMKLLGLVTRDAEIGELEEAFRQEPKLAFDLLRLVNSASMGLCGKIASFRQAITILGRRQLQRWLQLLLFAHQKEGVHGPSILMQQAATRGRLMELLSRETPAGASVDYQEEAFMVGLFSMLDVLMGAALDELLKPICLADRAERALLRREGDLGRMLALVEQAERRDLAAVTGSLSRLGISADSFNQMQIAALGWVHRLGISE
jgi:EAL and modified HD-GYP domain-containing signal transduction protein